MPRDDDLMLYRVISGICRIPPDLRMRLSAEQAKSRAHRIVDVKPIGDSKDVAATTRESVEFKRGEVIGLPWSAEDVPRYLVGIIEPVDAKKPALPPTPSASVSAGDTAVASPRRAARSE